jgi:hypothetical protein
MIAQLQTANVGLRGLVTKTDNIRPTSARSTLLMQQMGSINKSLGSMLGAVNGIDAQMKGMGSTLGALDGTLGTVNTDNTQIANTLGGINDGLATERGKVDQMTGDVSASASALGLLPAPLKTTNARLAYIDRDVCQMGVRGVTNNVSVHIGLLGLNNGSANIAATIIPPGAWLPYGNRPSCDTPITGGGAQ